MKFHLAALAAFLTLCIAPALRLRADVTLAAAISLKPALEKARPDLEKAAGEKITFTFGASGTLASQIQQGAPIDLFLSADRSTAEKLAAANAADKASLHVFAGNELVLIFSPLSSSAPPKSLADIPRLKSLAIGDPKIVPAGAYAQQLLTSLKLWDTLDKTTQLVTAENVAQVLSFVSRGDVEAGIVYASDAKAALPAPPTRATIVVATADPTLHRPIEYVSVIVSASQNKTAAAKIQQALTGEKVQSTLKAFGFTPTPLPPAAKSP